MSKTLEERAAECGIQRQFFDAAGIERVATNRTILHLANAMETHDEDLTKRLLFLSFDRPYDNVTVRLPFALADGSECRVLLESGTEIKGSISRAEGATDLTVSIPFGYHELVFDAPFDAKSFVLIATPKRCWYPEGQKRFWGISLQLYLIRSSDNWGMGDFADLTKLVDFLGPVGCDIVGINPLHQLDLEAPSAASPYSPISRRFLNVLYIAVPSVPGFRECESVHELLERTDFKELLAHARSSPHVNYEAVSILKLTALEILFRHFETQPSELRLRFANFKDAMGSALELNSTFLALRSYLIKLDDANRSWHKWPVEYKSPLSNSVRTFAERNLEAIEFYSWLQWLADEQLALAAGAAQKKGMEFRLYRDLAIGAASDGADAWTNPSAFVDQTSVGCPPDMFNLRGQDWGFQPPNPRSMRQHAYREFSQIVAANMRHAGGLRIDHVMGLLRLYCIPVGNKPDEGAYVHYPLADLLNILALESHRHQCMVVGEDLGTVPEGFREALEAAGVLSYRVLFFEQNWSTHVFIDPQFYPKLSIAVSGSHDLATLLGWWRESDIKLKADMKLYSDEESAQHQAQRAVERANLVRVANRLLIPLSDASTDEQIVDSVHEFLAKTTSTLVTVQLDDLIGEVDQVNLPGTFLEYPNWRRKYRLTLEECLGEDVVARLRRINELRDANPH